MSYTSSSGKGKGRSTSQETGWSNWEWDVAGCYWIRCRTTSSGEVKYEYENSNQANAVSQAEIPRSDLQTSYSSIPAEGQGESAEPAGDYYKHSGYPAGAVGIYNSVNATESPYYSGPYNNAISGNTSYFDSSSSYASPGPQVSYSPATPDTVSQELAKLSFNQTPIIGTIYENQSTGNDPQATALPAQQDAPPPKTIRREPGSKDTERLDARYRVVPTKESRGFWRVGRVFSMLWTEPAGHKKGPRDGTRNHSHISIIHYGESAFSEIRRFAVVRDQHGSCICLAIHTYSGHATLKYNLPDPENHSIIYTSQHCPDFHSVMGEDNVVYSEDLILDAIRVKPEQENHPLCQLHPKSRINYTKLYTVEKDVRVFNIGMVSNIASLTANSPLKPSKASRGSGSSRSSSRKGK